MATDSAAVLRERGVQVTAQRLAVLRAVAGHPHITADAVAEAVRREIGAISLQSVYDSLALLVAEGLLRRIQPSGSPARFEDRVGDNHHHLICRTCGGVVDVDCAVGAAPCLTPHHGGGYDIDEAEIAFWGRCPACREQSPEPAPRAPATAVRPGRTPKLPATALAAPAAAGTRIPRSHTRRNRRTT